MSPDGPHAPVRLTVLSSPTYLPVVRAAVERFCQLLGSDEETTGQVVLSVDEALTNVIKHAYAGAEDRPIQVTLAPCTGPDGRCLSIAIRDWGTACPRERIRGRDLDDVRPGGLGVHIMQCCMDRVDYQPGEDGGTVLTLCKDLGKAGQ
jgi:anti-sigma regulatory factor (Ser/Thr protein kinase)